MPSVNESSIPYSTNYMYTIYYEKEGEFHKGGNSYFKGTKTSSSAKYYKTYGVAQGVVKQLVANSLDMDIKDYVIVENIVKVTGRVLPVEEG